MKTKNFLLILVITTFFSLPSFAKGNKLGCSCHCQATNGQTRWIDLDMPLGSNNSCDPANGASCSIDGVNGVTRGCIKKINSTNTSLVAATPDSEAYSR